MLLCYGGCKIKPLNIYKIFLHIINENHINNIPLNKLSRGLHCFLLHIL
jgi:hypothetical protein